MSSTAKFLYFSILMTAISCGDVKQNGQKTKADPGVTVLSEDQVKNNGLYINHNSCGEGEITLFFVHGWCINQSYWSNQFDQYCKEYKLVSIDLPGFGKSGKNRDSWTIEEYAKDIGSVIEQLKLTNVILIGHSMGGDIILEAALEYDEIIALIGVDNFKDVGIEYNDQMKAEIDGFMIMLKDNFHQIAPAYAEDFLFHSSTDSTIKNRLMNDFRTADSTIAISSLGALFEYSSKEGEQLSKLNQKIYLINSDVSPTNIAGLEATGVNFEVVDINSTGHYPMIEKPEMFNQLLKQTIDKIEATLNKK